MSRGGEIKLYRRPLAGPTEGSLAPLIRPLLICEPNSTPDGSRKTKAGHGKLEVEESSGGELPAPICVSVAFCF